MFPHLISLDFLPWVFLFPFFEIFLGVLFGIIISLLCYLTNFPHNGVGFSSCFIMFIIVQCFLFVSIYLLLSLCCQLHCTLVFSLLLIISSTVCIHQTCLFWPSFNIVANLMKCWTPIRKFKKTFEVILCFFLLAYTTIIRLKIKVQWSI